MGSGMWSAMGIGMGMRDGAAANGLGDCSERGLGDDAEGLGNVVEQSLDAVDGLKRPVDLRGAPSKA